MKNINDVLKQKEIEYLQLQKDIEALRTAARLLADDSDSSSYGKPAASVPPLGQVRAPSPADSGYSTAWDAAAKKFP